MVVVARANLARMTDGLALGIGESGTPQSVKKVGVGNLSGEPLAKMWELQDGVRGSGSRARGYQDIVQLVSGRQTGEEC